MSDIEQLTTELENTQIAYQMAQEINQLKTGFLGRAAHELRSPLSSLISLHQLILFDFLEDQRELIRILAKFPKESSESKMLQILYDEKDEENSNDIIEYLKNKSTKK